jgi:peptidoglycan/LPS O-acetylase OafA/YrhL
MLRGLAILLVVAFHMRILSINPQFDRSTIPFPLAFVHAGHTGVSLFFVLSAFLLCQPFLREASGGQRVGRRRYFERRALRIVPAYYTAVVLVAAYQATRLGDLLAGVPYLVFINPRPPTLGQFSGPWWSLATEVQFYLVLPLLPVLVRTRTAALACLAYAVAYGVWLSGYLDADKTLKEAMQARLVVGQSVFGQGPIFIWGMLAAWVYRHHGPAIHERLVRSRFMRNGGADLVLVAVLALLYGLLSYVVRAGGLSLAMSPRHAWHIPEGGLWAAVVLLYLLAPLRTKVIVANRWFERLGTISYSLYLVHMPVIVLGRNAIHARFPNLIGPWDAATLAVAVGLGLVSVAFASLSYVIVERPFLVRKAKVSG